MVIVAHPAWVPVGRKHSRSMPVRPAVSLLEVTVVLAIVSLLLGLLLSAVQSVRATSSRLACANQLRQIGLALHLYHDSQHSFPPGVAHPRLSSSQPFGPDIDPYPLLNWPARILPFLEQDAAWRATADSYVIDPRAADLDLHPMYYRPLSFYTCPADSQRTRPNGPTTAGTTSYIGVAGTTWHQKDGLLYMDSYTRTSSVLDGTSNTLLAGERPPNVRLGYGRWHGGWGRWITADAYLGVRESFVPESICPQAPYAYQPGRLEDDCSAFHFWSLHPRGSNFLFVDGHVRLILYSGAATLPALATRDGGEPSIPSD